jgi:hypothetical protein
MAYPKKSRFVPAAVLLAGLLAACGSNDSGSPAASASLRMVNVTGQDLVLGLSGTTYLPNVLPDTLDTDGNAAGYVSVAQGSYAETISQNPPNASGALAPLAQNVVLYSGDSYTTLAFQTGGQIYATTLSDDVALPAAGSALLYVDYATGVSDQVDVYVLTGTTVPSGPPRQPFQGVEGLSAPVTLAPGSYNVVVTTAGDPSDIRLSLSGIALASTEVATLALTSTAGGSLVDGTTIVQGGAVTFHPSTSARVRILNAMPYSTSSPVSDVSVTVGTTALAPAQNYVPTAYSLVPAGSSVSAIGVTTSGVTVMPAGLPANTFVAGHDYSVLVYGMASAPLAEVIEDDNQLIAGSASVRIVDGTSLSGLALIVGTQQVADPVESYVPSAYAGVGVQPAADVQVVGGGYDQTVTGVTFKANHVYTVFLFSPDLPPLINQDR